MQYETPPRVMVRGDWMPDEWPPYPAELVARWNGWAVPRVDRDTMNRIIEDQTRLVEDGVETMEWDGERVKIGTYAAEEGEEPFYFIEPDEQGRYTLDNGWVWETVGEFADPAYPTDAQREAHKRFKDSLDCWSESRLVLDNGTHLFPVNAHLGQYHDGHPVHETIAMVLIDRAGNVTVQQEPLARRPNRAYDPPGGDPQT